MKHNSVAFIFIFTLAFISLNPLISSEQDIKNIPAVMEKIRKLKKPLAEIKNGLFCVICGSCLEQAGSMEMLSRYLQDRDERVRFSAVSALRNLKDPRAIPLLKMAMQEENNPIVKNAMRAAANALERCRMQGTQRFNKGRKIPEIELVPAPKTSLSLPVPGRRQPGKTGGKIMTVPYSLTEDIRQMVALGNMMIAATKKSLLVFKGNRQIKSHNADNGLFKGYINNIKVYKNLLLVIYNNNIDIFAVSSKKFKLLKRRPGKTNHMKRIHFNKDYLFYSKKNTLIAESLKSGKEVFRYKYKTDITKLSFYSPFLVVQNFGTLSLVHTKTFKLQYTLKRVERKKVKITVSVVQLAKPTPYKLPPPVKHFNWSHYTKGYLLGRLDSHGEFSLKSQPAILKLGTGQLLTRPTKKNPPFAATWLTKRRETANKKKPHLITMGSGFRLERVGEEYTLVSREPPHRRLVSFMFRDQKTNPAFYKFSHQGQEPSGRFRFAAITGEACWLATSNGMYSYDIKEKKWHYLPEEYSFSNGSTKSLAVTSRHIYGNRYALCRETRQAVKERERKELMVSGPEEEFAHGIAFVSKTYMGYYNEALDEEFLVPCPEPIGAIAFYGETLLAAGAGNLYVFDLQMQLLKRIPMPRVYNRDDPLPFSLAVDSSGIAWIAAYNSLLRIDLEEGRVDCFQLSFWYADDPFFVLPGTDYIWIMSIYGGRIFGFHKKHQRVFRLLDDDLDFRFFWEDGNYIYLGNSKLYRLDKRNMQLKVSGLMFESDIQAMGRRGDDYFLHTEGGVLQLDCNILEESFQ